MNIEVTELCYATDIMKNSTEELRKLQNAFQERF
jgi:hypothetical protein